MSNVFDNQITIILLSLIWGIVLALLIMKTCLNNTCIIKKIPIEIYKFNDIINENNKCYRLEKYFIS